METLAHWFGLGEGRDDFYIQTDRDFQLFFARADLESRVQTILTESYRGKNPPKFVIYGDWGTGKTHTLRHVKWKLEENDEFPSTVAFIELPDITAASTFSVAQELLLDAIGIETVSGWVNNFVLRYDSGAQERIKQVTQSADIARAFGSLVGFGDTRRIAWDWLRGSVLSSADARGAGLPPSLKESHQLVHVLRMLGHMCRDLEGATLVFLIDEGEKLQQVSKTDAINHWKNAFRILSETSTDELGLVIAAAFNDVDRMPEMLSDQQIMTRFGEPNYIQLNRFQSPEATEFVGALLQQWVDSGRRSELISDFVSEAEGEQVTATTFPFTDEGLDAFIEMATRNGGITSPRELQTHLTKIANRAMDDERRIMSGGYVRSVQM